MGIDLINYKGLYQSVAKSLPDKEKDELRVSPFNTVDTPLYMVIASPDNISLQDILITSEDVDSGSNVGTAVGILITDGGVGPFIYEVTDDPDSKFSISGNSLITDNPIDYFTQPTHNVTIKVTDINNNEFSKSFIITVNQEPAAPFINTKAVSFNGSTQHCETPYNINFSGLSRFTGSAWITLDDLVGSKCIMSHFGAAGKRGFRFSVIGDKLFIGISQDGTAQENFTGTTALTSGIKTHVAWSFDGDNQTIKTWINSVIDIDTITTYTSLNDNTTIPFRVGARGDSSFPEIDYYPGLIDEVSIYETSLTQLRIEEIYNLGITANIANMTSSSGLISWWRMGDGDTYPTLTDSVNSNDLSMESMNASNIVNFDYSNDYSMNFNGVDECIDTTLDLSGLTKFTISGWFYRASTTQRLDISQSNLANTNRVKIVRNNNGSIYAVIDSVNQQFSSNNTGWEHLVLVYDGGLSNPQRIKMYRNGAALTPISTPTWPTSLSSIDMNFKIGLDNGSSTYSQGNFDEVSVWAEALTAAQADEIYNSGEPCSLSNHSAFSDLISWWRCGEELNSPTMPDQQGINDGTLINMDETNRDSNTP